MENIFLLNMMLKVDGKFYDIVEYAGWSMDDHFPEGFYYNKGISYCTSALGTFCLDV